MYERNGKRCGSSGSGDGDGGYVCRCRDKTGGVETRGVCVWVRVVGGGRQ